MAIDDRNTKLAQTFKLSEADLQLNRQGRISATQKPILASARKARTIAIVIYIVMIALFVLVSIGMGLSLLFNSDGGATRLAILFAMAFAALLFAVVAANYYLHSRDVFAGTVSHAEGIAKPFMRQYRVLVSESGPTTPATGWFVKLGSKAFRLLSADQYAFFEEGVSYRIHYVKNPPIDVILSAEAV